MQISIEISSAFHAMISASGKIPDRDVWEIPEGGCINDVLAILGLTQVSALLLLNGEVTTEKAELKAKDVVKIYPMISGG